MRSDSPSCSSNLLAASSALFAGCGDVAQQMRSHDWSQTPLGAVDLWPPSLKTAIGFMLNATCPMFLVWGRGDRLLLYNDAYAALISGQPLSPPIGQPLDGQLAALGDPVLTAIEQVFATGQPVPSASKSSFPNDSHAADPQRAWSYSAVWDETGQVGGVVATGSFEPREAIAPPLSASSLQQQDTNLRRITDAVPALIAFVDTEQRYRFNNQTYAAWFGQSADSFYGKSVREVIGEAAYAAIRPYIEQALAGQFVTFEQQIPFHSGEMRYVEATYRPRFDDQGQVDGFVALISDIGDRKRAEAKRKQAEVALRESEARFRNIADSSPMMIWMSAPDGAGTWFNQRWSEFTGQTLEEALGDGWLAALHPGDAASIDQTCSQAHANREAVRLEYRLRRHDGTYCWVMDTAVPRLDDNGTYLGYIGSIIDISDRKRAEDERQRSEADARRSEAQLRLLTDSLPVLISYVDCDRRYRFVNQTYTDWFGLPPDKIIGRHVKDIVGEAAYQAICPDIDHVLSGQRLSSEKLVYFEPMGWRYVQRDFVPDVRDDGHVRGYYALVRDVTESRQTEAALFQSEERLRLAMEGAQMGTWDVDLTTGKALWSDQHFYMLGYEPTPTGEATEGMWSSRVHPDDQERVTHEWQRSRQEHRGYRADYRIVRADDGQTSWLAALGTFIYNDAGEAVRSIGVVFDISDRKQAEAALSESEERFRTLADNISQFAWMADPSGWIFWYNQRWFEYTGTTLDEMQGWGWQAVHHPEHVDRVTEKFRRHITNGEEWEDTFPLRSKDGTYGWFLSRAIPIRDEQGNVLRWFGTNTDITTYKQFEQTLEQRAQELAHLNQMLSSLTTDLKRRNQDLNQFAYVVSHDLKAPLRGIRNLAQWLKEDLDQVIPPDNQEQLDLLTVRVERMEHLINGLLEYSRAGRTRSLPEQVDVGKLLQEVIDSLSLPSGVTVQMLTPMPVLQARRLVLGQVFANLISNAVNYGCPKQNGTITLSAWERDKGYEFAIADYGPGIDPMYHEKIFGIFETLTSNDNPQSTGIGLSIVKKLVNEAGGTIWLDSQVGRGATFYFLWPKLEDISAGRAQ